MACNDLKGKIVLSITKLRVKEGEEEWDRVIFQS